MIKITLPDGAVKEVEKGTTPMDVAKGISEGLARNVISAKFNDTTVETTTPLTENGSLTLYTWNDDEGKKAFIDNIPRKKNPKHFRCTLLELLHAISTACTAGISA